MSMTKRHLESLPQEEQDKILGAHDPDKEPGEAERYIGEAVIKALALREEFRENDCGGVFDGHGVISDADPGL